MNIYINFYMNIFFLYEYFSINLVKSNDGTQPAIAFSKLTIETLEQGVKYVQN